MEQKKYSIQSLPLAKKKKKPTMHSFAFAPETTDVSNL